MPDQFDARTDALSAAIEKLSVEVSEGLAEQARYTGEAYGKLDAKMDAGFARLDTKVDALDAKVDAGFARVERKLDQFIDTQIQTNEIVDRRLRLLEE